MDLVMNVDGAALVLTCLDYTCPHCGAVEDDGCEVLAMDALHQVSCDSCHQRFHLSLIECADCGEEAAHSWKSAPDMAQLRQMHCIGCGQALLGHDCELRILG